MLSTSYRFDFKGLQRATGKDGNFALLSVAFEPPTGEVNGSDLVSGGWEVFASPTVVWMPAARTHFSTYVSLPVAQDYRADYQVDHWRAGLGVIYSFDRAPEAPLVIPPPGRE